MSPEIEADRIRHMIEDIDRIAAFVGDMDREQFLGDIKTIYAVSNAFIRIGEAAGALAEEVRLENPDIEWRDIRHFRNFLIHVYDKVDASHLWEAIVGDLPTLRARLAKLLSRYACGS